MYLPVGLLDLVLAGIPLDLEEFYSADLISFSDDDRRGRYVSRA
jgi:hypothetical protein